VAPPAHGASHGSKHDEDQADNQEDDPDLHRMAIFAINPMSNRMMPRMIIRSP
jgi:hypothetical protein